MNLKKVVIFAVTVLTAFSLSAPAFAVQTPAKKATPSKQGKMVKKVTKQKKVIQKKTVKGKVKGAF